MFAFGQYWTDGADTKYNDADTYVANIRRELGFEREQVVAEKSIKVLADPSKAITDYNTALNAELEKIRVQNQDDAKKLYEAGYSLELADKILRESVAESAFTRAKILKLEYPMVTDNETMIEAATGIRPHSAAKGMPGAGSNSVARAKGKATKAQLQGQIAALQGQIAQPQAQAQIAQGP